MNTTDEQNVENQKKKPLKKAFNIISTITLIGIIAILATVLIRMLAFNKTDVFGYKIYVIMSGSMVPEININDGVIIKESKEYNVGDIIAFESKSGKSVTIHRVIDIQEENGQKLYKTKGDGNNIEDRDLVQQDQIKGKSVGKIKNAGNILNFIMKNIVYVFIGIIAIITIALIRRLI